MIDLSGLTLEARRRVVWACGSAHDHDRLWLEAHIISENDPNTRLTLLVYEGNPPRGWVLVNRARNFAQAFNSQGKKIWDSRAL